MTQTRKANRLINETSPYLLQHAYNPVDWFPWCDEALTLARTQDKPILLSIGYSACHWCHVMEYESFENPMIAQYMNEHFICIKVDREERPDLDQIYMNAVQMMTGQGGWPMTMFLTPGLVPFFGGTYFPPVERMNMPSFPRIMLGVVKAFHEKRDEIVAESEILLTELKQPKLPLNLQENTGADFDSDYLTDAYQTLIDNFDSLHGGFGRAPKFPSTMVLEFLLRHFNRTGSHAGTNRNANRNDSEALKAVAFTCRKMAQGGIYDQLGGGFHRYSTDAYWLVPHFEKMLYDNALLARLYLHLFQATEDDFFRRIAEETLDYVAREMTAPNGSFYSTQDADSEGAEGKFFVWSLKEIEATLGEKDAHFFAAYYGVTAEGNFEGENILHTPQTKNDLAAELNLSEAELEKIILRSRQKLFAVREKRIKPARDEKILTDWNGLMMGSFAEAAAVLNRTDYLQLAQKNATLILDHMRREDLLFHTSKDGSQAKLNGYLDDYAFVAEGLLNLFEATGEWKWLQETEWLVKRMIEEFWDEEKGGFFFTGKSHESLIIRNKDFVDNATPAGNSSAAFVLLRLSILFNNEEYARMATNILRLLKESMSRYPSGFGHALCALDFHLAEVKEIVLILPTGKTQPEEDLRREVWRRYLPNKILIQATEDAQVPRNVLPFVQNRKAINSRPTAYVCVRNTCRQPVTTVEELRTLY